MNLLVAPSPGLQVATSSFVVFEVEDTGPGIAPDEQAHIFEPFVQTTAGVRIRKGSGLGLTISQQFVQLMGGTLRVDSQPGHGARFTVTLPLHVAAATTAATRDDARRVVALAPDQPVFRILVVDDEADNRQLLLTLLAPLGFDVREAGNGHEAVTIAQAWQPHLIWMDLRMPLLDGYAAAQQIKAAAPAPPPVIIAVSASSAADARATVLAAGCDDFIRKPFRDSEIFAALARYLGVRYVYADAEPAIAAHSSRPRAADGNLDAAALAALPADVLEELERAIVDADPVLIGQRIAQVRTQSATLADALTVRVDRFEHTHILACIAAARGLHG
jgi:CheY-like chemotaxis protein